MRMRLPPAPEMIDGRMSYEERRVYFEERKPAYQQTAWEVLDRAVLFFKYKLHNPNLSIDNQYSQDFQNPVWLDDSGSAINNLAIYGVGTPLPLPSRFGVKPMSCNDDCDLEKALKNSFSPNMTEQLLSDAQSAVFQDNLRRAVLEAAIACEVAVKQAFFAKATPAGAAFEFLEDKGKVHITIKDLIDPVAKQAFGRSFKEDARDHYENIDFLFRCRNKVAHRGELKYRDDSGEHLVDNDILASWWESVVTLLEWLHANTHT